MFSRWPRHPSTRAIAEDHLVRRDTNAIADGERGLFDATAVHDDAVTAAEIVDGGGIAFDVDARVAAGDEGVVERHVTVCVAPDEGRSRREIELLAYKT